MPSTTMLLNLRNNYFACKYNTKSLMQYGFPTKKYYIGFGEIHSMEANFQQSPASGDLVDDITHLRQRLQYLKRHIQTRSQEVKNEYNQALTKILDAEKAHSHFAEVFNKSKC